MEERKEIDFMMDGLIRQVSQDDEKGIARFLQANPYSAFEYYNFSVLKDRPNLFEQTLYCESWKSELFKKQICNILENPNGKNTFFIVGYQGCGKSTFIHSVINKYMETTNARVIVIDCDKKGKEKNHIKNVICKLLKNAINSSKNISNFIDFYNANYDVIDDLNNDVYDDFYDMINKINEDKGEYSSKDRDVSIQISKFVNSKLSIKEAFYLLLIWNMACNYLCPEKLEEKLMVFIDNLDCVDDYSELSEFISCVDGLTVDMSDKFERLKLCCSENCKETYVSKIKIFISMRETTKANLPSSHFSDAFRSIYTNKDMTEWYDKSEIIKKRIRKLLEFDKKGYLNEKQRQQLQIIIKITDDTYTKNVIYPLFNNNYRSAVDILVDVAKSNTNQMKTYSNLIDHKVHKYRNGARGILFKYIFDEFNKSDGNEECCFKRIGVIDLLNRSNNSISICRLILSYLSNYTETKCDSGRNSITLSEIIQAFRGIFPKNDVIKVLCEMFALRDSKWSHLVSFNQIEYNHIHKGVGSHIDVNLLNPNRTMIHYSCAGKIYIEYVATHFEFFTARIFKENKKALFCDVNLSIDPKTNNYICCDIINKVYTEVASCCSSLKEFNISLCDRGNYLNPYLTPEIYLDSPYICMFKRPDTEGKERRFKQFHEERIILTHINYIDCYRLYVLNCCDIVNHEQKVELNEKLTNCIAKYVALLKSDNILKSPHTYDEFVQHYNEQIGLLQGNWENFDIAISKNS